MLRLDEYVVEPAPPAAGERPASPSCLTLAERYGHGTLDTAVRGKATAACSTIWWWPTPRRRWRAEGRSRRATAGGHHLHLFLVDAAGRLPARGFGVVADPGGCAGSPWPSSRRPPRLVRSR
ncbi:MAG: hypothetical protein U0531_05380 [Dehalococcoidia bacterium]